MRSDLLHVVTVYFNPMRWESRIRLYKEFESHMLDSGVKLTSIECQLGERPYEIVGTNPNVNFIGVRSSTILWNKENLLNIAISRLPDDAKYICWADSDIYFRQSNWAKDTVHALQQYDIIQPWSDAYDLGPNDSHLAVYKSFCNQYWNGKSVVYGIDPSQTNFQRRVIGIEPSSQHPSQKLINQNIPNSQQFVNNISHDNKIHKPHPDVSDILKCLCECCRKCCNCPTNPPPYYGMVTDKQAAKMPWWKRDGGPHEYPHTGYVWATRRDILNKVGGLFDLAAMGAGDYHMALSIIGYADKSIPGNVSESYKKHLMEWQERALQHINFNVGYLQGTIEHSFHGAKSNRRYIDRWQIILQHGFDPDLDILRNTHGVFELRCTKPAMRHDLDLYFRQRNEDANTL